VFVSFVSAAYGLVVLDAAWRAYAAEVSCGMSLKLQGMRAVLVERDLAGDGAAAQASQDALKPQFGC
jgi:hypothetical protein